MKDVRDRREDDDRDDDRNGDDRKGISTKFSRLNITSNGAEVDVGSPIPAHDELDTAE